MAAFDPKRTLRLELLPTTLAYEAAAGTNLHSNSNKIENYAQLVVHGHALKQFRPYKQCCKLTFGYGGAIQLATLDNYDSVKLIKAADAA